MPVHPAQEIAIETHAAYEIKRREAEQKRESEAQSQK